MAITPMKRKFAAALLDGKTNTEAAIEAGYSKKTAAQIGSRLAKDKAVLGEMARKQKVDQAKAGAKHAAPSVATMAQASADPMAFLENMMMDEGEDPELRFKAAKELMPYKYAKRGDLGKKGQQQADAEKLKGIFAQSLPAPSMRQ